MAATSSTIRIIFDGDVRGLESASRRASRAIKDLGGAEDGFLRDSRGRFADKSDDYNRLSLSVGKLGTAFTGVAKAAGGLTAVTAVAGLGALQSQLASLDITAARAGIAMAAVGTGIAVMNRNVGGVVAGVRILKDFGTALGQLPDGAERLPSLVQRIIRVSAAVSLFAGGASLLARATVGMRGIGVVTGLISRFGGAVEGAAAPLRFVASAALGFLTVLKAFSIIKTVIPYVEKFTTGLAGINLGIQAISGLVVVLRQLAPAAALIPAALGGLGVVFGTIKLGLSGFADAVKKGGEDLAKLSPNARAAAEALRGMAPAFTGVKNAVQDSLFKDLAPQFRDLGAKYLPLLKTGLAGVAQPLNGMAKGFLATVTNARSLGDTRRILDGTKTALTGIEPALGNIAAGFLRLAAQGITHFAGLGKGISDLTLKFRVWADSFTLSGRFDAFVNRAITGFQQIGGILRNVGSILSTVFKGLSGGGPSDPLGAILRLTQAVDAFFKSVQGQDVLRTLAEILQHAGENASNLAQVFLNDILPAIKSFLPFLEQMSTAVNTGLVAGLKVLAPIFTALGDTLSALAPVLGPIVTGLVFMATVMTGLSIAAKIAGAAMVIFRTAVLAIKGIESIILLIGRLTGQMRLASAAATLFKGAALAAGLFLVADGINKMNTEASKGDPSKLGIMADSLQNLVGAGKQLASGDFSGILADIGSEWEETVRKFETGESAIGRIFGALRRELEGIKLSKIDFQVNTGPARAQVQQLLGEVNRSSPMVTINGNTNPAGFALQEILREIAAGKAFVNINGKTIPAEEALRYVEGLINNGSGTVDVNGNPVPAGEALKMFLEQTDHASAVVKIEGNVDPATGKVTQVVAFADGQVGRITVDARPDPATGRINGVVSYGNGQTARITIDGNQVPAHGQVDAVVHYGNGQTAIIKVDANTAAAQGAISSFYREWNGRTIDLRVSTAGRLAGGGPVFPGMGTFARGGAVFGPGTSTSDSIPTMLSSGEHVWTAREVRMAGGQGAVAAMRAAVRAGRIPRFAKGGANPSTTTSPTAMTAPEQPITVNVMLSQDQIAGIAQVEIARRDRATKRTVLAGSGVTF